MRAVYVLLVGMLLSGCAGSLIPPRLAFGDSESSTCKSYTVVTAPDGTVTETFKGCDIARGGVLSKQGASLVGDALGAIRQAAASFLGISTSPQPVIVVPAEPPPAPPEPDHP